MLKNFTVSVQSGNTIGLLRPRILIIKYMKEFLAKGHWVKVIIFFFKVCVTALPHGSDICHGINRSFQARHMIIYYTTVNVRGLSSDAETFYREVL